MISEQLKAKLANLPYEPGVYLMKDSRGEIIYVGKAKKLHNRVNQYFVGAHDFKTTKMVSHIADFDFIVVASEKEALVLEINLIKKHRPRYNIMFIDDSSYPYIKLTREQYPRLAVARDLKKDRNARYFGPYPDALAAHETVKLLLSLYPIRRCVSMPDKVCLYYHMHQCLGPCQYEVDPAVYEEISQKIISFLNGNTKEVEQELKARMQEASDRLAFEQAKEYADYLEAIRHIKDRQFIEVEQQGSMDVFAYYADRGYIAIQGFFVRHGTILEKEFKLTPLYGDAEDEFISFIIQFYENHPMATEIVLPPDTDGSALEDILKVHVFLPERGYRRKLIAMCQDNARRQLNLKFEVVEKQDELTRQAVAQLEADIGRPMNRIELFDNSHISGTFTVAACVVYEDGMPVKKDYRLYKLHTANSDVDSMKEVVYRRYFRILKENGRQPDAVLVDGGLTQIEAASSILESLGLPILVLGLVKDDHHNTSGLMRLDGSLVPIDKSSNLFFLLTRMQDEVHRVAIGYHRRLRQKAQTKSVLDEIEGIGPKRRKALLKAFGNFTGLKAASRQEIAGVVPAAAADKVYEALHAEE
jgi:excinuclease ABC subunit C